jgi:hypothetical protein
VLREELVGQGNQGVVVSEDEFFGSDIDERF